VTDMEVKGILFAMIDIDPEDTEGYNRWYDLDHLAEHVSKPDVLAAKRYVAPRDLRELADGGGSFTGGHPPYVTVYYLGIDDFASEEAWALWTTKDRGIIKSGRFWRSGKVVLTLRWRLGETFTRPPVLVSDEAVPYVAHRGILVALGRAPSAEERGDALRWWRETHLVDLLAVEGINAAMRFDPVEDEEQDMLLHLLLLEDDPAAVMPRVRGALRYGEAVGRYPAHGGVYESIAFLPYRVIVPLEYDFEW
jgi:hypothetical protein